MDTAIINPRLIRQFANATGHIAKTDRLDAHVLALYAQTLQPKPSVPSDTPTQHLRQLLQRREQLVQMIGTERNHLAAPNTTHTEGIKDHLAYLLTATTSLDTAIQHTIAASETHRHKHELLTSVPGIGNTIAATLIATLPELGSTSRQRIAALAGLAPYNRDSGHRSGKRHIQAGRTQTRTALFMAAMTGIRCNAVLRTFYQRLLKKGKAKMVALIACAHKLLGLLNAMLQNGLTWQDLRVSKDGVGPSSED